jgi:hypothetical protein
MNAYVAAVFASVACGASACGSISFMDLDTGRVASADGSVPDNTGEMTPEGSIPAPDAGPPCRQRSLPPLETAWPYQRTVASYETHFAANLPERAMCATAACHGGMVSTSTAMWLPPIDTPLIPPANVKLDANSVTNAIDGIWARVIPTMSQIPPPTDPVAPLIWHHAAPPDGSNQAPAYTPDQVAYVKAFIQAARECGWVQTQMQEQGKAPQNCVDGVCDCPITLDLRYCNQ